MGAPAGSGRTFAPCFTARVARTKEVQRGNTNSRSACVHVASGLPRTDSIEGPAGAGGGVAADVVGPATFAGAAGGAQDDASAQRTTARCTRRSRSRMRQADYDGTLTGTRRRRSASG